MANMISLKIDGKEVKVEEGVNLIDAAETAGVHIPNLCYMKGMKGIGACRLCLVEMEGGKAPVIACNTKAKEGMSILTNTDRVVEIRKFVTDLIVSMHPLDCMTCTKAGNCNLQKYAYDFEIKESSFSRKKFGYPTDESNPFIKRDPEYCVLCSRCIRICKAQDTNVLEFSGRGVGAKVVTGNEKPLQESSCTFCGSCIDACPVNALLEADRWRKGREWEYEKRASVCLSCGNACSIIVSTYGGEVVKVNSGAPDGASERYICAVGRFGFDSVNSDLRIKTPMKRVSGKLQETTWEDAIAITADKLKAAGSGAALLTSGNILNEEALLLSRFASDVIKTKNLDSSVSLYADPASMNGATADLEGADLFVAVGIAPDQWKRVLPALDAIIRKKINAGSAKLIVINNDDPRIMGVAAAALKGDEIKMLEELSQALISKGIKAPKDMVDALTAVNPSDEAMKAADLFIAASSPVVLSAPSLYRAASNLSLIKGDAVAVPFEANAKGVVMMGVVSDGKKFSQVFSSNTKLVYAIGEIPAAARPDTEFLIVQNSHMTDLAMQADLVLPSAAAFEAEGSVVDYLGRQKQVVKSCDPIGSAKAHDEIFILISEAMGSVLKKAKDTEIRKALKTKPKVSFSPFKKDKTDVADDEQFINSIRVTVINGSRLLWLKEIEKATIPA